MQLQNENYTDQKFHVVIKETWKKIEVLVEEPEEEEITDPEMKKQAEEMREGIFQMLKDSMLGNLEENDEDGEDEDEDDYEDDDDDEDEEGQDSEDKTKSSDTEEPNQEPPKAPPIEKADVFLFECDKDKNTTFGILQMEEGIAMGDVVKYDAKKPNIEFRNFGFRDKDKDPMIKLEPKDKIGIFSESKLQNVITLDKPAILFNNFGSALLLVEAGHGILFNKSPIFFEPGSKFIKEYFSVEERKEIKQNKFQLMIKTF